MNIKNEIKEALVENKRIFEILTVLFIIGFIIGCIFADDIASYLMPILKQAMGVEGGASSINAWDIMIHNESTAVMVFFGSIIFGIYAIISIFTNGFTIGFMAGYTVKSIPSLAIFLALIVPHGILEIPAFFCSDVAGILLFLFIFRVIRDKINKNTLKEGYENNKKTLKHAIVLLLLAIFLFAIAALIEGFITPHIGNIVSQQISGTKLF
ncbi:stage II sporulation protein M [uncultured Methanobrevibacter sp.]|uniref:stage II sporulation protein M n=1 Tax=uncultured Methanobrevibacter sp. TaxID=253161 RepID=UPI0025E8BE0D|nr:stage II sporulation protein M [uncultured Methanobrevibacter sp.]